MSFEIQERDVFDIRIISPSFFFTLWIAHPFVALESKDTPVRMRAVIHLMCSSSNNVSPEEKKEVRRG